MKTGKFVDLGIIDNIKIGYGTTNHINLKSIYLTFTSWIVPDEIVYDKYLRKKAQEIKIYFYQQPSDFFQKQSIVDLNIKKNGFKQKKPIFMNLEITLFPKEKINFKEQKLRDSLNKIAVSIIKNSLLPSDIKFSINKK